MQESKYIYLQIYFIQLSFEMEAVWFEMWPSQDYWDGTGFLIFCLVLKELFQWKVWGQNSTTEKEQILGAVLCERTRHPLLCLWGGNGSNELPEGMFWFIDVKLKILSKLLILSGERKCLFFNILWFNSVVQSFDFQS